VADGRAAGQGSSAGGGDGARGGQAGRRRRDGGGWLSVKKLRQAVVDGRAAGQVGGVAMAEVGCR